MDPVFAAELRSIYTSILCVCMLGLIGIMCEIRQYPDRDMTAPTLNCISYLILMLGAVAGMIRAGV